MKQIRKLTGEKCTLAPVDGSAAELVAAWSNSLEVSLRTGDTALSITCSRQRDYLEHMNSESQFGFLIVDKEGNSVGIIRLMQVDFANRNGILGIFIGEEKARGKGIGSEAIKLLLDFAFNALNLRNVMLETFSFNKGAIRAFEKCGFKTIGRRRKAVLYGSREYDRIYMDILNSEFEGSYIHMILDQIERES